MKNHKRYQTSIILLLVCCALIYKGIRDGQTPMIVVGVFAGVFAILRILMIRVLGNVEDTNISSDTDMTSQYLLTNYERYIEMYVLYKSGNVEILYEERDGVLLYHQKDDMYYASAKTQAAVIDIMKLVPQDSRGLCACDDIFLETLQKQNAYGTMFLSYNMVYEKTEMVTIANETLEIKSLTLDEESIVKESYSNPIYDQDGYIASCIKNGMLGAYQDGQLVGYIGLHNSGAIGLLEVFDGFRSQGVAKTLIASMINHCLKMDKIAYTQVQTTNEVSLKLQASLGFTRADKPCIWVFRK